MMIPYTDHECRLKLEELYDGRSIVVPCNYDHALNMLNVAMYYIKEEQKKTFDLLKKDYK